MHVDERGLVVADAGDDVEVVHLVRPKDYGPQLVADKPLLGVNHIYGMYCPPTMDPRADGTVGCAERAASTARYPATAYMARVGQIRQVIPLTRCGIHCEHSWKRPETGTIYEINRVSVGLEWAGCGWVRADGSMPGHSGIDVTRPDFVQRGHLYWQDTTPEQVHAASLFWKAVVDWSGMPPENAIRGHGELAHGGHELCPGPPVLESLRNVVLPYLRGELAPVPEQLEVFGGEPLCSADPAMVFIEHGGALSDEELHRYFTADEIERLAKSGAFTHDDADAQQTTLAWNFDPAALDVPA